MRKGSWHIVAIALLGLVLALALGAFAHTIARSTVALPATTLEQARNERLAPAQANRAKPGAKPKKTKAKARTTPTPTPTATNPTTTTDDGSGNNRGRGRGRGSDDSSGSGSGGSRNSGKGSDEREVEDD